MKTCMKTATRFVVCLWAILFAFQMNSAAQDTTAVEKGNDIVSVLEAQGNYTWLVEALQRTGLAETLRSGDSYTLFAPTDEAVAAQEDSLASMDTEKLTELLRYHLVIDTISRQHASSLRTLMTVQGGTLDVTMNEDGARVNDATIVAADVEAANGVIHGIDAVLMPPATPEDPEGEQEDGQSDS